MKKAGIKLDISRIENNEIEVKIEVSYSFFLAFQINWYTLRFNDKAFKDFQSCLKNGIKSWHGESSIWRADKIFIKKQNPTNNFRDIRMYQRFFILSFSIVPATFSHEIVRTIVETKV